MLPDKRDEINFWRGFLLAVPLGLAVWALIGWILFRIFARH